MSFQYQILLHYRSHPTSRSIYQILSNGSDDCRLHDKATYGKKVSFVPQNHHESSLRSHCILSYLYSFIILIRCPQECVGKYISLHHDPKNQVKNTYYEKRILLFQNHLRRTLHINSYPFYSLVLSKRS
jgi:hypothetical protein